MAELGQAQVEDEIGVEDKTDKTKVMLNSTQFKFKLKLKKLKNVPKVGGGGVNPNWDIVQNFLDFLF